MLSRQFEVQGELLAKQKFLCGRDEKHWFVASIAENEPVSTVVGAKIALKPEEVRTREQALGVSRKESFGRRNAAYVRQGEWFFLSEPRVKRCYRSGGETVYVSGKSLGHLCRGLQAVTGT